MKNTGVIRKIDELGRIVIPKEIRKSFNIRNGEDVQIYIEDDKIILKKYQKIYALKDNAQRYLENLSKLIKGDFIITDKEKVVASLNKNFVGEKIDQKSIGLINDRKQEEGHSILIGGNKIDKNYYLSPIIIDADAVGSIILINNKEIEDNDKIIAQVVHILLSMEMY